MPIEKRVLIVFVAGGVLLLYSILLQKAVERPIPLNRIDVFFSRWLGIIAIIVGVILLLIDFVRS